MVRCCLHFFDQGSGISGCLQPSRAQVFPSAKDSASAGRLRLASTLRLKILPSRRSGPNNAFCNLAQHSCFASDAASNSPRMQCSGAGRSLVQAKNVDNDYNARVLIATHCPLVLAILAGRPTRSESMVFPWPISRDVISTESDSTLT